MSAPRGILKNSTPYVHSAPKAGGSKLKQTLAVAQHDSGTGSGGSKGTGPSGKSGKNGRVEKGAKQSKAKKARIEAGGEDVDMNGSGDEDDEGEYESEGERGEDEDEEEMGTDEEIERSKKGKTKATPKRKRPTTAEDFGSALQSLLTESSRPTKSKPTKTSKPSSSAPSTSTPSDPSPGPSTLTSASKPKTKGQLPILSLSRAPLPPSAAESKLERRAARALRQAKEEKEDRARVRDVVEGWGHPKAGPAGEFVGGGEFEKGLRKTAQRGVIKLFNAILTAHKQSAENDLTIRSTKKHKEQPISGIKGFGKKDKDNVLGRGNKEELTKEGFLELVKRGTA